MLCGVPPTIGDCGRLSRFCVFADRRSHLRFIAPLAQQATKRAGQLSRRLQLQRAAWLRTTSARSFALVVRARVSTQLFSRRATSANRRPPAKQAAAAAAALGDIRSARSLRATGAATWRRRRRRRRRRRAASSRRFKRPNFPQFSLHFARALGFKRAPPPLAERSTMRAARPACKRRARAFRGFERLRRRLQV